MSVGQNQYAVIVVEAMKRSLLNAVERLTHEHPELGEPVLVLLTTNPAGYTKYPPDKLQVISCDFSVQSIQMALQQISTPIRAVLCRGDMYVQYLRRLVPYLPVEVKISSEKALEIATNKRLMRQVFTKQYPDITPKYVHVKPDDLASLVELTATLQYPIIIKPASLASSLMIQKCDSSEQLRKALDITFERLQSVYQREHRSESPEIIIEEYLEGDLYSVDSYVLAPGQFFHTPLVSYVAAKQLGIDDFFLYKRTTPVELSEQDTVAARTVAEQSITAAGLQYSSVHVEMVQTNSGWKIIEIGPRVGRFRNIMYREAFGVDHGYNDVLVHLGIEPELQLKQPPSYCAAYSIYPETEGTLQSISGLDSIPEHIHSVVYASAHAQPGQVVLYARNGGHALYEIIFANDSKAAFDHECRWFEANVKAIVSTK